MEFNINGKPDPNILYVDFDLDKGCFVLTFRDGSIREVYFED